MPQPCFRPIAQLGAFVVLCSGVACSRASGTGAPQVEPALQQRRVGASSSADEAPSATQGPATRATWPELIRSGLWQDAHAALTAGGTFPSKPEERLALGWVALELERFAEAERALADLAVELPLQRATIIESHARAALEAGPFAAAVDYYQAQPNPLAHGRAALAELRAGNSTRAARLVEGAVQAAHLADRKASQSAPRIETVTRLVRARVALAEGKREAARSDLVWILSEDPLHPEATAAERLFSASKLAPLDKATHVRRADRFAESGDVERVEHELELMRAAPGADPGVLAITRARAWAHYNARQDYAVASELFVRLAELEPSEQPQHLFYAARALSRAGRDRQAIARYAELVRRHPKAREAEEARYLIGRLHYILADWPAAEQALSQYLISHRRGRFAKVADYERAVTRLAAGKHRQAAKDLAALAKAAAEPQDRASLIELEAVALSAYDVPSAKAHFREAMELWPLSLPALFAARRLRQLGAEPAAPPKDDTAAPTALALQLPPTVEQLQRIGFDRLAADALASTERALAQQHAPRGGEAVCQLYASLADAEHRYRWGRVVVKESALLSHPKAANRWAWDCLYPRPYSRLVGSVAQRTGIGETLLYAVMRRESAFRVDALSSAGARGLMQLMPNTAERVARDHRMEHDPSRVIAPAHNLALAGNYLKVLSQMFGARWPLVLAAYNAGPKAVSQWLEHGESLPLDVWVARIPFSETRHYVSHVMSNWIRYNTLAGQASPTLELAIPAGLRAPADAY